MAKNGKTVPKPMMWYHITTRFLGNRVLMYPRKMDDATYANPSICVCPSVEQSLVAMPIFSHKQRRLWVYKTSFPASNKYTKQIYDYRVTQEHRIHQRSVFVLHRIIGQDHDGFDTRWIQEVKKSSMCLFDNIQDNTRTQAIHTICGIQINIFKYILRDRA